MKHITDSTPNIDTGFGSSILGTRIVSKRDLLAASSRVSKLMGFTTPAVTQLFRTQAKVTTVKLEPFAPTGSFKIRGAYFVLDRLIQEADTTPRVYAASTGNFGVALAAAAQLLGIELTVIVPNTCSEKKQQHIRSNGANLQVVGQVINESLEMASSLAEKNGATFVDSCNADVILGHSSLGTELFLEHKHIDRIYFPIGIGSGISGLALAKRAFSPKTKLIGVVPNACMAWVHSWKENKPVFSAPLDTRADGLRVAIPKLETLRFLKNEMDGIITVSEEDLSRASELCKSATGIVPEGAGATGLAGLIKESENGQIDSVNVATVVCGGELFQ